VPTADRSARLFRQATEAMGYGFWTYIALAAAVGVVLHSFSGRFGACCLGGAALCSALSLFVSAWSVGFRVNLGWAPPMFVVGFVVALPACLVVGLPFWFVRWLRNPYA
jgi:hypothetical protein